jgi:hypothetical protein
VLSLPPAFVLSQDQTLMLRIQSRLNHVSESTRTHTCLKPTVRFSAPSQPAPHPVDAEHRRKVSEPRNRVYSLDKRDRRSLFLRIQISSDPASSAAHVSLSSILQLSNNRPEIPVKTFPQSPRSNPEPPISIAANSKENTRASNFVASSAAALVQ